MELDSLNNAKAGGPRACCTLHLSVDELTRYSPETISLGRVDPIGYLVSLCLE